MNLLEIYVVEKGVIAVHIFALTMPQNLKKHNNFKKSINNNIYNMF